MPASIAVAAAGSGDLDAMLERFATQDPQALVSRAEGLFVQEGESPLTEQEAQTLEQNIRNLQDALPFSSLWRYEASDFTLPQYEPSGYVALESLLPPDDMVMADLEALSADMRTAWEDLLSDPAVQETIAELQADLEALNLGGVALELEAAEGNPEAEASIVETALRAVVPEDDIAPLMASFRDVRDTLSDMALPAGMLALLALVLVWTQRQTLANRLPGVSRVLSDFRAYAGEYRFRYLLPDLLTATNLLTALVNMALFPILYPIDPTLAFGVAAVLLTTGALADMVDGGAARLVRSSSEKPAYLAAIYRKLGLTAWADTIEKDIISEESQEAVAYVDDIGDGASFGLNPGEMKAVVAATAMVSQGVPVWFACATALLIGGIYTYGALKRLVDFVKRALRNLSDRLGRFIGNSTTGTAPIALAAAYMIDAHVPEMLIPLLLLLTSVFSFHIMNDTENLHPHLGRPFLRALRVLLTSPTNSEARAEFGPALRYLLVVPGAFFTSLGLTSYYMGLDGFFSAALLWSAAYLLADQGAAPGASVWEPLALWHVPAEERNAAREDLRKREIGAGVRKGPTDSSRGVSSETVEPTNAVATSPTSPLTDPSSSPQALERGFALMLGDRFTAVQEHNDAAMEKGRIVVTPDEGGAARKAEPASSLPPRWSSLANPGALPNLNAPANGTAAYSRVPARSSHVWNDEGADIRHAAATEAGLLFSESEHLIGFLRECEAQSASSPFSLAGIFDTLYRSRDHKVLTETFTQLMALRDIPPQVGTSTAAKGPIVAPATAALGRAASSSLRVVPGGLGAAH